MRMRGAQCTFICRPHEGHLLCLIQQRGHKAKTLEKADDAYTAPAYLCHAKWLVIDWASDAAQTQQAPGDQVLDWLVVDHYALDRRWEQTMRPYSPLQNLIMAGHEQTKLTALRLVGEMDAGPVYTKKQLLLVGAAQGIYVRAGGLSAEIIEWMIENNPLPVEQVGEAVLFKRRKPDQSRLPETGSLSNTYDFIRMLDAEGYPHAFVEHGQFILKLTKAKIENGRLVAEVEINEKF
jgi:hypothetical protein